ncbi:DUF4389 domain-containing protein [Taibaiella soli]|uniref:DUF4389 domain-containing protein n=1 Tax=Taibaiella soli TaxID=1649169 RepID=A0A2W2AYV5_9BACT|nr:DUF4389 domain-containing protein [Taibaiella soli]PZF73194.1 hypothetical protein DN068_10000 [Taibaiella soli]
MKLTIVHQSQYSRGELLLRTFFGFFYIVIPHAFCLYFLGIWAAILHIITFFSILFTQRYPKANFDYFLKFFRWQLRVNARMLNLSDGYPAFGLDATDDKTSLEVPYQEHVPWTKALLIFFLGVFILIPHILCLVLLSIGAWFMILFGWIAVLFTGNYPEGMHQYMVRFLRWSMRVNLYLYFMYPYYPPFNGDPDTDAGSIMDKMDFAPAS